jgi:uncharacterized protein (TIGR00299 family) protein
MEKVLLLETVGGIAGDMFLAAALDLGVDLEALRAQLAKLSLPGYRLERTRQVRHEISGTHRDVVVDEKEHHPHRALKDIEAMIRASGLSEAAKNGALKVFRIVGEAEAKVHGVKVEEVTFHEVGAVDSIVDICGAAIVLELLGQPKVFATSPPLGSGTIRGAHGVIPVPGPATLEILRDLPVRFEGVGELTTPTGAALLKAFATVGPLPECTLEKIGYGVGTKDFADRPNVLRASLGRLAHAGVAGTFVVEANLDDATPQLLGHLLEKVLALGAVDATLVPTTMKKSRPGHLFSIVVPADKRDLIIETVLTESTTLGVRYSRVERVALEREHVEVKTAFGPVRVKLGKRNGKVLNATPEYEDCRALAEKASVPLKQIWGEAMASCAALLARAAAQ